jgi:hypothetical protein
MKKLISERTATHLVNRQERRTSSTRIEGSAQSSVTEVNSPTAR